MPRRHPSVLLTGCLLFAGASVLPALAQTKDASAPASRTGVFPATWFDAASPSNALDMVLRVPGFTLVEADADVRGYAGAAGNVLVDGSRPTSKRQDTTQLLKQISAREVERIELLYPGTPGIDMGGYPVLANVVRRRNAGREWALESGVVAGDGWAAPLLLAEHGRRWGEHVLNLSLRSVPELDDDSGRGRIDKAADGGAESSRWNVRKHQRKQDAEANWRQPLTGGTLSLNLAERGEVADTGSAVSGNDDERIEEREDYREAEFGARYLRQFGAGTTLEAMTTRQRGRQRNSEHSREDEDEAQYDERIDTGEDIARIDMTHVATARLSLQASIETSRNTLRSDNRLKENGVDVVLPEARTQVSENRREAAAGVTWRPNDHWALEGSMRIEQSRLEQSGDTGLRRDFRYPKPRVAIRWSRNERTQWRFALSREVGQLDFGDFAASASLDSGTVSAGNAKLRPERSLRTELGWEWRPGEDNSLSLGWVHERLDDVVDRVLVVAGDDVFDAPGNIGGGRRDTLSLDLSVPLALGHGPALHLRGSLLARRSRVTDPVTGDSRGISGEKPFDGEIEITQELPALRSNWGLLLEHIGERSIKYRYDRITREAEALGWTLYGERRFGDGWRLRLEATDLLGRVFTQTRTKFDGSRADSDLEEVERRRRVSPGTLMVSIRRTVGG